MRRPLLLVPVIVSLVAAVSLGGVAAAGDQPLTEKQWRKKANILCARANKLSDKAARQSFGKLKPDEQPSLDQMTAYVQRVEPIVTDLVDDLDALHEPKQLAKKVSRFLKTAERELARVVADPSLALEANPFSDTGLRSDALGLNACS